MKKFLIIVIVFISFLNAQKLTISESINTGLKNNYNIKIAESKLNEVSAGYDEISAQFYPKLSLTAGYTRLSEVDPFQIKLPNLPTAITVQEAILNNYNFKATVTQPIFTGFKLSAQKKSIEHLKNAQYNELNVEINNSVFQIIQSYYNHLKTIKSREALLKRLESVKNHLNNTKNYYENGLATKNDMLRIEVLLSDIKIKILETENAVTITKNLLNKAMGLEITNNTEIDTALTIIIQNYDEASLITEASGNRKDLKSINELILSNEENVRANTADYYPSLYGFASFNYDKPNQRLMPLKNEFKDTWAVGVTLNWEVWNWGATSAKREKAIEREKQTGLAKSNLSDMIKNEVINNFYEYQTSLKKMELYSLQTVQAEENLKEVKAKYNEQLASVTDLTDAEAVLLEAQIKLISVKADEEILKAKLNKSLGRNLY